jgi:LPS export ABC transporter protein LptC
MKSWSRLLAYAGGIAVVGGVYFISVANRGGGGTDPTAVQAPDPGYAARDAQVIETGYDGRERYRLNASVVRQRSDGGAIDLENLKMDFHPGAQGQLAGEKPLTGKAASEIWHLTSDHGQVQANGDDVQLTGNVVVTGPAPGTDGLMTLTTDTMSINTPTQFISTDDAVRFRWSGYDLTAKGMQADLKAGTLRLESDVHGEFSPK